MRSRRLPLFHRLWTAGRHTGLTWLVYCLAVTDLEICRVGDPYSYGLAIVEMSNEDEAGEVVKELGGAGCGSSVAMRVLHNGKLIAAPDALYRP
jgi:hypothetical protein